MAKATRTEVQWGIRNDKTGYIETGGIDPGGNIVRQFSESVARYISKNPGRTLVKRTVIHIAPIEYDWEDQA